VVLLEVLCARPAIELSCPSEQVNLAEWGLLCKNNGKLEEIVDSSIKEQINQNSLRIFSEIVEKCLQDDGCDRPTMVDVLWDLEYVLQLHREPNEDSSSSAFVSLQLRNDECLPSLSTLIEVDGMSIDRVDESTSTTLMTLDRISCEANQGTTIKSHHKLILTLHRSTNSHSIAYHTIVILFKVEQVKEILCDSVIAIIFKLIFSNIKIFSLSIRSILSSTNQLKPKILTHFTLISHAHSHPLHKSTRLKLK
jgi:hypothetical protein